MHQGSYTQDPSRYPDLTLPSYFYVSHQATWHGAAHPSFVISSWTGFSHLVPDIWKSLPQHCWMPTCERSLPQHCWSFPPHPHLPPLDLQIGPRRLLPLLWGNLGSPRSLRKAFLLAVFCAWPGSMPDPYVTWTHGAHLYGPACGFTPVREFTLGSFFSPSLCFFFPAVPGTLVWPAALSACAPCLQNPLPGSFQSCDWHLMLPIRGENSYCFSI